jgi:glycosidase
MTYPGAPCIYYGDEVGIRGSSELDQRFNDAEARWAFPWHDLSSWDRQLLDYFKTAIKLRHDYAALRQGRFDQVFAKDDCYIFLRSDQANTMLVAVNAGSSPVDARLDIAEHLGDGSIFTPVLGPGTPLQVSGGAISFQVHARSGFVLARS